MSIRLSWMLALLALLASTVPRARAQVSCDALPNPLYLQVGDTQEPLMKALGRALRDEPDPITLVYLTSGSCTNVEAIYTDVKMTKNPLYVPSTAESASWTTDMPSLPCTIDPAGRSVDVANSALFVSSCDASAPPAGVELVQGPVQPYGFVVPEASSQKAITAEEAYFVFGFGDTGMVTPWNDEQFLFIRTITKSTLLTLASMTTGLANAAKWRGQMFDKSSEVMSALVASAQPEKSLGILGVELYDRSRDKLNVLAFRAFGQKYAYYPDSTALAFDKRNVRDGHYVPWSPTVWLTKVDADHRPLNARAGRVIDLILGRADPAPTFESLKTVIGVGLIPDCAMSVTRSFEGGELSLYQPAEPCGCYYEAQVAASSNAGCRPCDVSNPCATGVCRHGFCEAR